MSFETIHAEHEDEQDQEFLAVSEHRNGQEIGHENGQANGREEVLGPEDDALLLPKFINTNLKDLQSTLVPFVAEIFLMVKLGGTRKTAKFLSDELGRKMSRTPIETLMARVRKGELIVTQEDLERASTTHPLARKFVQKAPWLVDPQSKALITPEQPQAKPKPKGKRGRPKKVLPPVDDAAVGSGGVASMNQEVDAEALKVKAILQANRRQGQEDNQPEPKPALGVLGVNLRDPKIMEEHRGPLENLMAMKMKRLSGKAV